MNNLGALRLVAAGLVVAGHSYALVGAAAPSWFGVPVHIVGLHVFFSISGYLVARSWQDDPSPVRYAARRLLRIMPALWVLVAVTVAVLGPALTTLGWREYWVAGETRLYLWNAALAPFFGLAGVFQDGRALTAVNGSLWSLPIEAAMYALLPLYGGAGAFARQVALPAAVVASAAGAYLFTVVWPDQLEPVLWWSSVPFGLRYAGDFVLGAAIRSWRLEWAMRPQAALLTLGALGLVPAGPVLAAAVQAATPFVVLSFGLAPRPLLAGVGARTDLSYGLYLYAFPVQQAAVSAFGTGIGAGGVAALGLCGAGVLALLSWRYVERPLLRLKPSRPVGILRSAA